MKRAAIALLLATAGCHHAAPAPTDSAYELLLAQISPRGGVSVDTARAAFSIIFTPLPGVTTPPGLPSTIGDGTPALHWILAHQKELTAPQLDTLQHFLVMERPLADDATQKRFQMLVDAASAVIGPKLGQPILPITSIVYADDVEVKHTIPYAWTLSYDAAGERSGPWASCTIRFNHLMLTATDRAVAETVPHEVFHCYQGYMSPDLDDLHDVPDWILEGGAEWAGADIAGHADVPYSAATGEPGRAWSKCLQHPESTLYGLSYDGICFFAAMAADGRPLWTHFDAVLTGFYVGDDDGAFLGGLGDQGLAVDWATSYLRVPALGSEWDAHGPGVTSDKVAPINVNLENGSTQTDSLLPASSKDYLVSVTAEVVQLRLPPLARLHGDSPGSFDSLAATGDWCTRAGGCDCPMGSARAGTHLAELPAGDYYLAVGAGVGAPSWFAGGETLDAYCNSDRVDKCVQGTWLMQNAVGVPDTAGMPQISCSFRTPIGTVVSFAKSGASSEDFSATSPITCVTPMLVITSTIAGHESATVTADHGAMQVSNIDSSGVSVMTDVGGSMGFGIDFGSLYGATGVTSSSLSYSCNGNNLQLTSSTGVTYQLTKQ